MGVKEKYRGKPPLPSDWAERLRRLPPLLAGHDVCLACLFGSAMAGCDGYAGRKSLAISAWLTSPAQASVSDLSTLRLRKPWGPTAWN